MLREKPANKAAITKLVNFLNEVTFILRGSGADADFQYLQKSHNVSKKTYSDLKIMNYVVYDGSRHVWKGGQDVRKIALKILDHRLKKSKKKIHVPLPGLAAIGEALQTVSERLAHIMLQQEKFLKTAKTGQISVDGDLFRVDDQLLFLAGSIASRVYFDHIPTEGEDVHHTVELNRRIAFAAKGLLSCLKDNS